MGISTCIYLGPYIKCLIQKIESEELITGCAKCKKAISGKFCSECGATRESYTVKTVCSKVNTWDLTDELNEQLMTVHPMSGHIYEDFDIFIPNVKIEGITRKIHLSDQLGLEITPELITQERIAFETKFSKELSLIKKKYEDSAFIEWGFLLYYH